MLIGVHETTVSVSVQPAARSVYRPRFDWSPRRWALLGALVAAFAALTVAVLLRTEMVRFDRSVMMLHIKNRYHFGYLPLHYYVMLGQRGPSTLLALPWFVWLARRNRSLRPLVTLGVALLLLNVGVGAVKLACGRIGPLHTNASTLIFAGGDIYPSGHVSNAVVLYGVIAGLAISHRRLVTRCAVFICVTVGLATIYLRTHWVSDVLGGWLAGAIVLLLVPPFVPPAEALVDEALRRWRARHPKRAKAAAASPELEALITVPDRPEALDPAVSSTQSRRTEVSGESSHG